MARVHINGLLRGTPGSSAAILASAGLGGLILVDGGLLNGAGTADGIRIAQALGASSAIAIDYDGFHDADDWGAGAVMRMNSVAYGDSPGNYPAQRIYRIAPCRGDMNNDGAVDNGDIDPFVLGLTDSAGYAAAFPGLDGSMVYHGDANCDAVFDNSDIDPFVDRLLAQCCEADCGCGEARGLGAPTPAEIAALLFANVRTELLDPLAAAITDYAEHVEDAGQQSFWLAVCDMLGA